MGCGGSSALPQQYNLPDPRDFEVDEDFVPVNGRNSPSDLGYPREPPPRKPGLGDRLATLEDKLGALEGCYNDERKENTLNLTRLNDTLRRLEENLDRGGPRASEDRYPPGGFIRGLPALDSQEYYDYYMNYYSNYQRYLAAHHAGGGATAPAHYGSYPYGSPGYEAARPPPPPPPPALPAPQANVSAAATDSVQHASQTGQQSSNQGEREFRAAGITDSRRASRTTEHRDEARRVVEGRPAAVTYQEQEEQHRRATPPQPIPGAYSPPVPSRQAQPAQSVSRPQERPHASEYYQPQQRQPSACASTSSQTRAPQAPLEAHRETPGYSTQHEGHQTQPEPPAYTASPNGRLLPALSQEAPPLDGGLISQAAANGHIPSHEEAFDDGFEQSEMPQSSKSSRRRRRRGHSDTRRDNRNSNSSSETGRVDRGMSGSLIGRGSTPATDI